MDLAEYFCCAIVRTCLFDLWLSELLILKWGWRFMFIQVNVVFVYCGGLDSNLLGFGFYYCVLGRKMRRLMLGTLLLRFDIIRFEHIVWSTLVVGLLFRYWVYFRLGSQLQQVVPFHILLLKDVLDGTVFIRLIIDSVINLLSWLVLLLVSL